jgi:uncharacterized protein (TIGR03086 family)
MSAHDIDLLESVFTKTEAIIAGVRPDQTLLASPCAEFDVVQLVDHMVGWASSFAARAAGMPFEGDPNDYRAGTNPAAEFRSAATTIVGAYRSVADASAKMPVGMLLMEYIVHGWDLATATGQPVKFTREEADRGLETGVGMLKPEYRGPGMAFGYEAPVSQTQWQAAME